ncbi:4-diphosphocytidyl-2-C-methyl-D-erythritol kinase, chloroplastic-like [Phragmites australis]|uniref:4-diphosphocytidyl-2-C-methyl-D-erythritol kinase, chloroplastic-like n=1 Tax=Phragmites australis TaxID=29695 RepID=UPI002D798DAF|nr:4-diphosphocytidyl-2-C-methyl-D-erythritol kinase, chloroplastic-like [Phragmites australis]
MACSAHLLSQSLYSSSHRASPAAPRFQGRPPASASPGVRPSLSVRGRRGLCLRVTASFEPGRRQVEVSYDPQAKLNQLADQIDKNAGMTRLNLFSPCKVNVFLRITGKRPDGFHDLASLFHVISLGDTIKFSLSPSKSKDRLSTNVAGVPVDESNLIIKALNLYRKKTGTDNYFWIHLDKKVPTGAGLGGGSSNAATALWAANQFSGCIASEKDLQEWSGEIGSDIPFFFSRGVAYCTGRGEIIQDIPNPLPENLPMVLIKPPEACSTTEVYKRFRLEQTSRADPLTLLKEITQNGISQDVCVNDLEPPAFEVLPSLKKVKKRIIAANRGDYSAVFMSGSGSTIVGVGSPDPPSFVYDDEDYKDVFVSEAYFLTRNENEWYGEPISSKGTFSREDLRASVAD